MTTANAIAAVSVSLAALAMIYTVVRLAVSDAVRALEIKIAKGYVANPTCHAIRAACDKLRAAEDAAQ